ncbi:MAG: ABC transporter ATP-binding protein [Fusicatenibacter sp.]|nr:ABC transporter ATP-binding protein [Lachnospiraceae bacterium]MDY2937294.1 ABC transporter ATP-binding protein [Fusicatenibacter sp.]
MKKYLKKYWLYTILAPLFMIFEVLMDLVQPKMMSTIVDVGVLGIGNNGVSDLSIVIHTGIQMILVVAFGGFCGVMAGVFSNLSSQNLGNDMRKDVFRRTMELSFQQTDQFTTGSLVTRVTNDITQIQNMVMQCIRGFVRNMMFFAGGIFCMATLDLSFGAVVACAFPIVLICVVFFLSKVNPLFSVLQQKLDHVNSVMQENIAGVRVVKAYVREEYEEERFGKANKDLVDTQLHILTLISFMSPIMNIVLNITAVAVIYVGAIHVQEGSVTPGNIMAAITYLSQILNSVMMFAMIFQNISRGMASYRRLEEVLECKPAIADGDGAKTKIRGKVEFKNVSFSYPKSNGESVLRGINLTIEPGETLGILGATGSGKSSLVHLIPRFYDVTEGQVLVDDVDVRDYKQKDLRDKVAITLQKSELYSDTIRGNLRWGNPEASDEEICRAAGAAQAEEFILHQKDGYDTMVAEKGMSLSGGQKQRLSIARALLKNAEILIMDDSTSALDLKTEAKLYEALKQEYPGTTRIIIAQRIASVKDANRIAVIENGQIVDCGPHAYLMEHCEIYRDIYQSQLKGNPLEVNKKEEA